MIGYITKCAATDLRIQWTGWAISGALKSEKFYDLAGSGTFILLTGLVTAWGVRLGTFLFMRIVKDGQDRRFNHVRQPRDILCLSGCLTRLPTLMLNSEQRDEPLGLRDYLGWGIWSRAFVTEAITSASIQPPQGKCIQSGLWGDSQHPNYLGEIMQWSGLWLCFVCDEGSPVCHLLCLSGSYCVTLMAFPSWRSGVQTLPSRTLLWPIPEF
uniref:Si:ch211-210c8.6 n=1 Tax=Oncorhynchus kisutch TaxID=8019 RepID=A0A8C7G0E9_ONCKI